MKLVRKALSCLAALAVALAAVPSAAQQVVGYIGTAGAGTPLAASSANPLPVFSTTFAQTGTASLSAGTTTSNVALGAAGAYAIVTNGGSVTAYVAFGGSSVTATTGSYAILPGQVAIFQTGAATYMAGITGSSTAALTVLSGNQGGIGASSITIGTVTQGTAGASPWLVNSPDAASATGTITGTQTVVLSVPAGGYATFGLQVSGTWTGTIVVKASIDCTNYYQTTVVPVTTGVEAGVLSANGLFQGNMAGFKCIEAQGVSVATGTAHVTLVGNVGAATVMQDNLPWTVVSAPYPYTALGCGQLAAFSTATLLSAVSGGIPSGATQATLSVETNIVRYRDDGTAPTASVGTPLPTGGVPWPYSGPLSAIEFIPETGSATVDVCFYK
jgi:hypothetical protein